MAELNEIIAKNLTMYRKQIQLTQAELAEKINYSDKSISKWERGEGVPDIAILKKLADFYGVTVNDFLSENKDIKPIKLKKRIFQKHIIVPSLSVGIVWLVATLVFIGLNIFPNILTPYSWLCFIFAIPVSAIVITVFASIWHQHITNFLSISAIGWTITLSLNLSVPIFSSWIVYLIPTVLQVLIIFWFFLKRK